MIAAYLEWERQKMNVLKYLLFWVKGCCESELIGFGIIKYR